MFGRRFLPQTIVSPRGVSLNLSWGCVWRVRHLTSMLVNRPRHN
jgi:hypothetical protein